MIEVFKLLSHLAYGDVVLTILLFMGAVSGFILIRLHYRVKLAKYKHIATIHAMEKEFSNGFIHAYKNKLDELYKERRWKIKGE